MSGRCPQKKRINNGSGSGLDTRGQTETWGAKGHLATDGDDLMRDMKCGRIAGNGETVM